MKLFIVMIIKSELIPAGEKEKSIVIYKSKETLQWIAKHYPPYGSTMNSNIFWKQNNM